ERLDKAEAVETLHLRVHDDDVVGAPPLGVRPQCVEGRAAVGGTVGIGPPCGQLAQQGLAAGRRIVHHQHVLAAEVEVLAGELGGPPAIVPPIASSAEYPYIRSAPGFQLVMVAPASSPTMASSECWTMAASRPSSSRARLRT